MKHAFFLVPTERGVGLTSVALGLVRALDQIGLSVNFCKPIAQRSDRPDQSTCLASTMLAKDPPEPLTRSAAQELFSRDSDRLVEKVVALVREAGEGVDVVVVEGLAPRVSGEFSGRMNAIMGEGLDAQIILVADADDDPQVFEQKLQIVAQPFGGLDTDKICGCVVNKIGMPADRRIGPAIRFETANPTMREIDLETVGARYPVFEREGFRLLGAVPWDPSLIAPRTSDIFTYLDAEVIHAGAQRSRRVNRISLLARQVANLADQFTPGSLLVTSGDRDDVILAVAMAAMQGTPLAGLLLTSGLRPAPSVTELCRPALETGLPVALVPDNSFDTALRLAQIDPEVPLDDVTRIDRVMNDVARHLDLDWLRTHCETPREARMSPHAFRFQLVELARAADRRIVLPEGDEPRTIEAAAVCHERGIARCTLLGRQVDVRRAAASRGVRLPETLEIVEPASVRERYVDRLHELRKHKGLARPMAEEQLTDNVVLGTMMMVQREFDGLVSGAVHTTAHTIRPALQLIKTAPDASLVSSVFFMLLPEQVVIYGDCAVNPDPDAAQLAEIALQSADSAAAFGLPPRVAMISYSTGKSGSGGDVDKVREATRLARDARPDLLIDGPLQYDAAAIPEVARTKAPDSPVAGRATVFIFPDLNTGNTTYKAVQRSANVLSIGPMLQGLRQPVNDLSRGASVDDIVYTIAITAVQADRIAATG